MSSGGTTSIDDLPISPQTDGNIQLKLQEKMSNGGGGGAPGAINVGNNGNIVIDNQVKKLSAERDKDTSDMNALVTGIQQASISGMLSLPTRDIPQHQNHLTQDKQIQANYVPKGPDDYIKEHQTPEDIIKKNAKREMSDHSLDEYYNELHIPIMICVLYFLFHLPVVRRNIFKYIPFLFNKDGNLNGSGYIANSVMFAGLCYFTFKSINYMSV
jgi:hypothetical protein